MPVLKKSPRIIFYFVGILLVLNTTIGCQKQSDVINTASHPVPAAQIASTGAEDDSAKQFLTELEMRSSFKDRSDYIAAHQEEANKVAASKNPAIAKRFASMMSPPQAAMSPASGASR